MSDDALAGELVDAGGLMRRSGVMSPTGHVNFTGRWGADRMLLTARGTIDQLTRDTLAVVTFDGQVVEGEPDDSTREIVGMHATVYRARADVGAVVHTHSPCSTAFALAHRPLPCRYEALLRRGQRGAVPVAPWAPRGSTAFFDGIAETLAAAPGTSALLLGNHGLLAFGASPTGAVKLLMAVEEAAGAELAASSLGGAVDLPESATRVGEPSAAAGGDTDH